MDRQLGLVANGGADQNNVHWMELKMSGGGNQTNF
jgi:hypothetical protein